MVIENRWHECIRTNLCDGQMHFYASRGKVQLSVDIEAKLD